MMHNGRMVRDLHAQLENLRVQLVGAVKLVAIDS
jgi:hypothetical protein